MSKKQIIFRFSLGFCFIIIGMLGQAYVGGLIFQCFTSFGVSAVACGIIYLLTKKQDYKYIQEILSDLSCSDNVSDYTNEREL